MSRFEEFPWGQDKWRSLWASQCSSQGTPGSTHPEVEEAATWISLAGGLVMEQLERKFHHGSRGCFPRQ